MGSYAISGMCNFCNNNDWSFRVARMESNSDFLKLYSINVNIKHGYEYSCHCEIFAIKEGVSELSKSTAVFESSKKMMLPILYTVLTTICAFLSLVFSGIKPIIDFGWMMTMGLIVSLIVTFTLLPSLLNLLSSETEIAIQDTEKSIVTSALASFTKNNEILIYGTTVIIIFLSLFGITKLEVENSFINYFNKETEIYKGMKEIDENLGGTTP